MTPRSPLPPCRQPGCPNLAESRGLCREHGTFQEKANYVHKGSAKERGYGAEWRKLRKHVLLEEPVCQACGVSFSQEVDHHLPVERGGTHQRHNLWALCARCHTIKTNIERTEADTQKVIERLLGKVREMGGRVNSSTRNALGPRPTFARATAKSEQKPG